MELENPFAEILPAGNSLLDFPCCERVAYFGGFELMIDVSGIRRGRENVFGGSFPGSSGERGITGEDLAWNG